MTDFQFVIADRDARKQASEISAKLSAIQGPATVVEQAAIKPDIKAAYDYDEETADSIPAFCCEECDWVNGEVCL